MPQKGFLKQNGMHIVVKLGKALGLTFLSSIVQSYLCCVLGGVEVGVLSPYLKPVKVLK